MSQIIKNPVAVTTGGGISAYDKYAGRNVFPELSNLYDVFIAFERAYNTAFAVV